VKAISLLGSTGSIGTQTLDIVAQYPDQFRVVGLAAGRNVEMLASQIRQFRPEIAAICIEDKLPALKEAIADLDPQPILVTAMQKPSSQGLLAAPVCSRQLPRLKRVKILL